MNYRSQLKGWAIDRVIESWKVIVPYEGQPVPVRNMEELKKQADDLADYAYVPDKDFSDCIAHISEILKSSPDALEKVHMLQAELGVIEEEIERQVGVHNATNGVQQETVQ